SGNTCLGKGDILLAQGGDVATSKVGLADGPRRDVQDAIAVLINIRIQVRNAYGTTHDTTRHTLRGPPYCEQAVGWEGPVVPEWDQSRPTMGRMWPSKSDLVMVPSISEMTILVKRDHR